MTENKVLMQEAREALRGKWGFAVGVSALYGLIVVVLGSLKTPGLVIEFLLKGPLQVGLSIIFLALARKQPAELKELFEGFNDFIRNFVAHLFTVLFVVLWGLLFIVPGIVAAYAYSQTFFILAEDKSISARDAIRKSKQMMQGHKKKLFYLSVRFFGWGLLCILTAGIGFLWLIPYISVTMAKFYEDISGTSASPVVPTAA